MGMGVASSKPLPQQYIHSGIHSSGYVKGQVSDKSYSSKQIPVSGLTSGHSVEVISKVVASKQYPMSVNDHASTDVGGADSSRDHVMSGDPGVRECPSGASSPSSTPNNTLVKGSKVHLQYDPLAASSSESRLLGQTRTQHQPPAGDQLESRSDTNLASYHSYPGPASSEGSEGAGARGAHRTKPPTLRTPDKKLSGPGGQEVIGQGSGVITGQARMNGHAGESQGKRRRRGRGGGGGGGRGGKNRTSLIYFRTVTVEGYITYKYTFRVTY